MQGATIDFLLWPMDQFTIKNSKFLPLSYRSKKTAWSHELGKRVFSLFKSDHDENDDLCFVAGGAVRGPGPKKYGAPGAHAERRAVSGDGKKRGAGLQRHPI